MLNRGFVRRRRGLGAAARARRGMGTDAQPLTAIECLREDDATPLGRLPLGAKALRRLVEPSPSVVATRYPAVLEALTYNAPRAACGTQMRVALY